MAQKTKEEVAQERTDAVVESLNEVTEAAQKSAVEAREDEPSAAETDEEYYERVRNVPGIFGDTDTTAGASASETDVPSAKNEQATVAVAQKDVEATQDSDSPEAQATDDEARRQVDVALDTTASAEEVNQADSDKPENAVDVVNAIEDADSVDEVDRLSANDDRKTVQDAADKRRSELE